MFLSAGVRFTNYLLTRIVGGAVSSVFSLDFFRAGPNLSFLGTTTAREG